jgi:hypothetical protein
MLLPHATVTAILERVVQRLAAQNPESGRKGGRTMAMDDRDILELLKEELAFVEQGGYGRSVRTPWLPKSAFQDSLTCINYADPDRPNPCNECHLIDFVTKEHRSEEVPCHFIALNEAGETIKDLEAQGDQAKLEATLKQWMKAKINQIEEERAASAARKQSVA